LKDYSVNKFAAKVIITVILIALALAGVQSLTLAQNEPTAVELASFDVVPLDNAVRIDWETGTEFSTVGFFIKRGDPGGPYQTLGYLGEDGIIYATGQGAIGSSYSETDTQVENGQRFTYILYELESNSTEKELAQETVTVGIPPTNTPVVASINPVGPTATATPRLTAQATATGSAPNNSISATAVPPTAAGPTFVTITPDPQRNQPATAVSNTSAGPSQPVNTNSSAAANNSSPENNTVNTTGSVNSASALEEEPETIAFNPAQAAPPVQEEYPEATTAVLDAPTAYPNENNNVSAAVEATATTVPVIGSQGDANTQNQNSGSSASSSRGTIFLWLGFIMALLIFITGIIGSILLFVRKSH
jgi:hypothetical protein